MYYLLIALCTFLLFFFFYKKTKAFMKKEKELFAFQMAHELRSSLTILMGYAEALKDFELGSSQRKEIAAKILSSSQKLDQIINSLLLLAKEEKKESCDLFKSLEECKKELCLLHPKAKISIEQKPEPFFLSIEKGLLEIVLRNLLENAIRYSKKDPKIAVSFLEKHTHIEISIEDEGQGIAQEEQERIFDRFYTSDKKLGCGLGLFIVQKIVERSHGKISLSSSVGKGSRFSLLLPKTFQQD